MFGPRLQKLLMGFIGFGAKGKDDVETDKDHWQQGPVSYGDIWHKCRKLVPAWDAANSPQNQSISMRLPMLYRL